MKMICTETRFIDFAGNLKRIPTLYPVSLEEAMRNYEIVPEGEINEAARFMRRCLTIRPADRPSAATLLQDRWLTHA